MAKVKKKVVDGIEFDSATEADYYLVLSEMESNGELIDLGLQPEFVLFESFRVRNRTVRGMVYTPDFCYTDPDGVFHVVEVKGYARDRYNITRKIFLYMYGESCVFHEVKRKGKKFVERVW